ncbi:hypothetical protein ACQKP0_00485 [Heyndrickxia sp. NPDC080065]|uniref:hypothetical protein n=1 Tax=Heyndrickxia sp. NPDC080065 TaxID=3390568 RepID=UPI003D053BF2
MTKNKLIILFIGLSFFLSGWQSVKASQQKSIEKDYYDLGFKSVSNAIQETESYYKTNLDLPKKLPPLDFTHSFGRFNEENESLEIEYLNEEKHFKYIINVIPAKERGKLLSSTDAIIPLKDGTEAYYTTSGINGRDLITFMFEKNNWIYILSIEEDLIDKPLPTLVGIANSL